MSCQVKNAYSSDDKMALLAAWGGATRCCFMIMGPIVGVGIYQSLDTNEKNFTKVGELQDVSDCMDEYTVVDTDAIYSDLDSLNTKLRTLLVFWWINIGFFILEVTAILIGFFFAVIDSCGYDLIENCSKNCSMLCKEARDFLKAYKILN